MNCIEIWRNDERGYIYYCSTIDYSQSQIRGREQTKGIKG